MDVARAVRSICTFCSRCHRLRRAAAAGRDLLLPRGHADARVPPWLSIRRCMERTKEATRSSTTSSRLEPGRRRGSGLGLRQPVAGVRAGRDRRRRPCEVPARAGPGCCGPRAWPGRQAAPSPTRPSTTASPLSEADMEALEAKQLRVLHDPADARLTASMLKLKSTEIAQASTELLLEAAGTDLLPLPKAPARLIRSSGTHVRGRCRSYISLRARDHYLRWLDGDPEGHPGAGAPGASMSTTTPIANAGASDATLDQYSDYSRRPSVMRSRRPRNVPAWAMLVLAGLWPGSPLA